MSFNNKIPLDFLKTVKLQILKWSWSSTTQHMEQKTNKKDG